MSTADPETLAVYDQNAVAYGERFQITHFPRLERFLDQVKPGGRILDLGCGVGGCSARMAERGFAPVALDASAGMAAEAQRLFGLSVQVATFDAVPTMGRFDGVWAHFSLLHADPDHLTRHLSEIHTALLPEGIFLLALKIGDGCARDPLGRRYIYANEGTLDHMLRCAGFTPVHSETGVVDRFDGVKAPFVAVTAHA